MTADATKHDAPGMWLVLAMTAICMMVIAYNTTAVVTILPQLGTALDMRPSTLQWVMAIYMVAAASLVPVMGRGGDLYGKMTIFTFGIACFACGSLVAAIATDSPLLLLGRAIQGVGAAAMFGTSLSVLTAATPEARRPFVLGIWGALIALGMSLGPIIGGLFGEYISWHWVFYLEVIMLGIATILARAVVKANYVPNLAKSGDSLDVVGAILLVCALAPLAYGLSLSETAGWTNPITLGATGFAAVVMIGFCLHEQHTANPLLQIGYFRHPRYITAALGMFIVGFVLLGYFVYYALFAQSPDTLAMSPVAAGASMLPLTGVMLIFSVVAPQKLASYSFRWPLTLGMLCLAGSCYLLSFTSNTSGYNEIWWKFMLLGMGLGLTMPLLPRVGLRILAEEHAGQGSGTINTFFYFGATVGTVLCGLVKFITIKAHISEVVSALPVNSTKREALVAALSSGSGNEIQAALATLDPPTSEALRVALQDVQDNAFSAVMITCAAVSLIGALLVCFLMRGPVPEAQSAVSLLRKPK